MDAPPLHPCQTCGACCAFFRVSFYWREAELEGNPAAVPVGLTQDYTENLRTMKGTTDKHRCRCVALEGKVGKNVQCSVYAQRPSPCRDFTASFEYGLHKPRCDEARAQYKMAPLRRADWKKWNEIHFHGQDRHPDQNPAARLSANGDSCYNPSHENNPENAPDGTST